MPTLKVTTNNKSKRGGARPNSGRKPKAEEDKKKYRRVGMNISLESYEVYKTLKNKTAAFEKFLLSLREE